MRVYNCSLAVQPSAPGKILGWCGSVSNYLGILLLFRKQLHFMGLTPIQDCRQFIHSFIHLFNTQVFSATCVPGCVQVSRELYEVIEVGLGCHGSPQKLGPGTGVTPTSHDTSAWPCRMSRSEPDEEGRNEEWGGLKQCGGCGGAAGSL